MGEPSTFKLEDPKLEDPKLEGNLEAKNPELEAKDQILFDCLGNKDMLATLDSVIRIIRHGDSRACVRLLKVVVTNARACETFTRATCTTRSCIEEDRRGHKSVVVYSPGSLFPNGLLVLEKFVNELDPKVPEDNAARSALRKLAQFMNTYGTSLKRPEKGVPKRQWALLLAQHLFSELAVRSKYTIDHHYKKTEGDPKTCPCELHDKLRGRYGDTSFGCPDAWHGSADILFENVSIKVTEEEDSDDEDDSADRTARRIPSGSSGFGGDSSKVKSGEKVMDNSAEMLAQCIVFSFLQRKQNASRMDHYLVPSIEVNTTSIIISFYDCENDILLQSAELPLFVGDELSSTTIVCVWLAINYRCFCPGLAEGMINHKTEFHPQLGADLEKYTANVEMPLHMDKELPTLDNWSHTTKKLVRVHPTMDRFFSMKKRKTE